MHTCNSSSQAKLGLEPSPLSALSQGALGAAVSAYTCVHVVCVSFCTCFATSCVDMSCLVLLINKYVYIYMCRKI